MAWTLITGASSGIGLAMARQLAGEGWSLILVARREDRLNRLAEELRRPGIEVVVLPADLSSPDAPAALCAACEARGLAVDLLVNNAGYGLQGKHLEFEPTRVAAMFRLNIDALTFLCSYFGPSMVARGRGYILNVASASAFLPSPYVAAYAASQAYVGSFSEALRFELRGTGVSVTTLYPGVTETEFNEVAGARHPPLMNLSVLSAEAVARVALRATFARRRVTIPGLINKINAFFSQVLHRGLITAIAGRLLESANGHRPS